MAKGNMLGRRLLSAYKAGISTDRFQYIITAGYIVEPRFSVIDIDPGLALSGMFEMIPLIQGQFCVKCHRTALYASCYFSIIVLFQASRFSEMSSSRYFEITASNPFSSENQYVSITIPCSGMT